MDVASIDEEARLRCNLAHRRYTLSRCLAAWGYPIFQSNSVIVFAGAEAPEEELVISKKAAPESNRISTMATAACAVTSTEDWVLSLAFRG